MKNIKKASAMFASLVKSKNSLYLHIFKSKMFIKDAVYERPYILNVCILNGFQLKSLCTIAVGLLPKMILIKHIKRK